MGETDMTLDKLPVGQTRRIAAVGGQGALRRRLLDMGLTPKTQVTVQKVAPMGDPIELRLRGYELTRKGKGLEFHRREAYHYEHLAYNFRDKKAEPFIVTVEYDPTGAPKTAHDHEGQEFDYVLTGHMKIVLAGNEVYLGPGDSIYYDSSIPHAMYAVETDCRFIAVVIK